MSAFLALLVALATSATTGCGPDAREQRARDPRPDIVLISMDTTRADHLSAYGYDRPTSSRLAALATEGTRLQTAYSPSATTGPSHASLFTGLPPMAHGVRKNGHVLDPAYETLAERLAERGYETGAIVSSYVLSRRFGYDQGFAAFDDDFSQARTPEGTTLWEGEEIVGRFYGEAEDTTDRALRWLAGRESPEKPFFLFVHYFDPHDPYAPPPDYLPPFSPGRKEALKLNRAVFLYDTLLSLTDREIGRLLDGIEAKGRGQDPLVVVTADHGEGLMSHGHMYHGVHVYEEAVRVPLIVRWPGHVAAGRVVETPAAVVDLAPTILSLIGDGQGDPFGGAGFASLLLAGSEPAADGDSPIFLYRRHYSRSNYSGDEELGEEQSAVGEKFAVRLGSWKLIEGPEEGTLELFDLERDPREQVNLAGEEPARVAALRQLIADWRARYGTDRGIAPLPEIDRARLRALGYVE